MESDAKVSVSVRFGIEYVEMYNIAHIIGTGNGTIYVPHLSHVENDI